MMLVISDVDKRETDSSRLQCNGIPAGAIPVFSLHVNINFAINIFKKCSDISTIFFLPFVKRKRLNLHDSTKLSDELSSN